MDRTSGQKAARRYSPSDMLASQRHTDDKVDAALQMGLRSHSAQDSGSRGNLWRIPLQQIRYIRTALYADAVPPG